MSYVRKLNYSITFLHIPWKNEFSDIKPPAAPGCKLAMKIPAVELNYSIIFLHIPWKNEFSDIKPPAAPGCKSAMKIPAVSFFGNNNNQEKDTITWVCACSWFQKMFNQPIIWRLWQGGKSVLFSKKFLWKTTTQQSYFTWRDLQS